MKPTRENLPVFVYGTLKPEGRLHGAIAHLLKSSQSAELEGFQMYKLGWFPGIVPIRDRPLVNVKGWVLGFSPDNWERALYILDDVEGEGKLFARMKVRVRIESGEYVLAWTYIYLGVITPTAKLIESNEWKVEQNGY